MSRWAGRAGRADVVPAQPFASRARAAAAAGGGGFAEALPASAVHEWLVLTLIAACVGANLFFTNF